jgi:hypothetical protein
MQSSAALEGVGMTVRGRQRWRVWGSKAGQPDAGGRAAEHGRHRWPDAGEHGRPGRLERERSVRENRSL